MKKTRLSSLHLPTSALLLLLALFLTACQATPEIPAPTETIRATTVQAATPTTPPSLEPLIPTDTPVPTVTPTPDTGHNLNAWHFPANFPGFEHHHGVNPADYVDVFGPTLSDYLATYSPISYPWQTPDENSPVGLGHHHGYVWLYDQARSDDPHTGCELFNNGGHLPTDSLNCVTDVLMEIHTDGTQAHLRKRFHSHYLFMRVCDQATLTQCGIVATGGWVDYGILHTPYKNAHCPLAGVDPEVPEGYSFNLGQPPYRASQVAWKGNKVVQIWSGLRPNTVVADLYPEQPNHTIGVVWSTLDAWGIIDAEHCADSAFDVSGTTQGIPGLNNSLFQIWEIYLYDHPPAPFTGWTDRWGHVVECTKAGTDCVPFIVTEGVPDGAALLNRQVRQGDAEAAPFLEFDPGGEVLLAPMP